MELQLLCQTQGELIMAKTEIRTCDICGVACKTITMTLYDNEYQQEVSVTDLCEKHLNLIRSYIRHACPAVSKLPID